MIYKYIAKQSLSEDEISKVQELEKLIILKDNIHLKLELDYKRMSYLKDDIDSNKKQENSDLADEYLCFDNTRLIGYLGICSFGGDSIELNGMVDPDYRGQKVFTTLFELALENRKDCKSGMLLLSDANSVQGLNFIKKNHAKYHHSEFEMLLNEDRYKSNTQSRKQISLREATKEDALEVFHQNSIYFQSETNSDEVTIDEINPEDEKEKGVFIYLAIWEEKIIGKVNIQYNDEISGIYGLGVKPEYRSQGFGRSILLKAIELIRKNTDSQIILQVETKNTNALKLYESCGFESIYSMEYYKI